MKKIIYLIGLGLVISLFTGCATTQLQTQAKMTRSIFLDPVVKSKRTVFVAVRNTSGQEVHLKHKLISQLRSKGYTITDDPNMAKYILMVNILFANNAKEANAANAAETGGTVGAVTGSMSSGRDGIIDGLAAAAIGGILGKVTEDDIFRMVVDIDIKEKTNQNVSVSDGSSIGQATITNQRRAGFANQFAGPIGSKDGAGKLNDNITEEKNQNYATHYIEKRTRIFAEATRMDLSLSKAMPILEDKISKSIAGIF